MIDKRTLFILGAGASCPYGYPSGEQLRKRVVLCRMEDHNRDVHDQHGQPIGESTRREILNFIKAFEDSHLKSIDLFMERNPKRAPTGKYIIAFEIFWAETKSLFGERAEVQQEYLRTFTNIRQSPPAQEQYLRKSTFQGDDWYSHLFNRLTEGMTAKDVLPDFSDDKITFITFNYDRSLEHFLFTSLRNSLTEVPHDRICDCLKKLRIIHVFGQIAPLPWQDAAEGIDYSPRTITTDLLEKATHNIKTIFEENEAPHVSQARNLIQSAERIFFLGLGYAEENMNLLTPSPLIEPSCQIYGTAYGLVEAEIRRIRKQIYRKFNRDRSVSTSLSQILIADMDCLKLLRYYSL